MSQRTGWVGVGISLALAASASAEEITVTTYYPAPRGVYQELRTQGNVQIGTTGAPADPERAPRLHVVQEQSAPLFPDRFPAFRVDDEAGDPTPFLIDQAGNVGIGTTAPAGLLHTVAPTGPTFVLESSDANVAIGELLGALQFMGTDSSPRTGALIRAVAEGGWGPIVLDAPTVLQFFTQDGDAGQDALSNPRMVIDEQGRVGIGTAAPDSELHIRNTNPGNTRFNLENTDTGGQTWALQSTGQGFVEGAGHFTITEVGQGPRLTIRSGGNVGIGTTDPLADAPGGVTTGNLDVNDVFIRAANGGNGAWASQGAWQTGMWCGLSTESCGPLGCDPGPVWQSLPSVCQGHDPRVSCPPGFKPINTASMTNAGTRTSYMCIKE